ncbi:MAG: DUF932 domain-containing protein [Candidatus Marinimicrobia bacterium]|nr:DUF932 domain-containing protein [Candidatus Neomarinimicrobiota bacterium]
MGLLLHCGAESATLDELASIPLPKETRTYKPVAHADLANMLSSMASDMLPENELVNTQLGLARDGQKMFGLHTFKNGHADLGLSIGFRNSYDRSMSIGIVTGSSVFVCDNLMLSGDLKILRKHTSKVVSDIETLALSAIFKSRANFNQIKQDVSIMQQIPMSDDEAYRMLGLIYGRGIITPRQIPVVKKEWLKPTHDAFEDRNLWSFYNACTESLKTAPPQSIMERHLALHDCLMQN